MMFSMQGRNTPLGAAGMLVALVLVICLAECATEQRINSRGSKASNLIDKVNGWRSQRGGSCLSYGHSCWGAHGKRSGRPPATAPDWYLSRVLRRIAGNTEMNVPRQQSTNNDDINAIFQGDAEDTAPSSKLISENDEAPIDLNSVRSPEAKPMLDDELLSKMKFWQFMTRLSDDN